MLFSKITYNNTIVPDSIVHFSIYNECMSDMREFIMLGL